jgi:glutaminyl-peptide cyclotransferase
MVLGRQMVDKFQSLSKASDLRKISSLSQKSNLSTKGSVLAPFLIPRVSGTLGNKLVQKHIIDLFDKMNWHIEQNTFSQDTPFGEIEFNNIVVTKDVNAHKRFVLAAHFDSKYFKEFEFIGAIDSAAPCAILMVRYSLIGCSYYFG